jgi:hypothetical protein
MRVDDNSIFDSLCAVHVTSECPRAVQFMLAHISTGVSEIRHSFAGDDVASVINAYMVGIHAVFIFAIASSALAILLAFLLPSQKLPTHDSDQKDATNVS